MITKDDIGKKVISQHYGEGVIINFKKDLPSYNFRYPVVVKFKQDTVCFNSKGRFDESYEETTIDIKLLTGEQQ